MDPAIADAGDVRLSRAYEDTTPLGQFGVELRSRGPSSPREALPVTPHAEIATLVINCTDPEPMIAMYSALGAVPDERYPDHGALIISGITVCFQVAEDHVAPSWPTGPNPTTIHLDFFVDSVDEMELHLLQHGASKATLQPHEEHGLVVMIDPAGHPFCIGTRV